MIWFSNKWCSTLGITVWFSLSSNLGTSSYFNVNLGQQYFICLLISHIKRNPNVSFVYKNKMTYYYFFENYFLMMCSLEFILARCSTAWIVHWLKYVINFLGIANHTWTMLGVMQRHIWRTSQEIWVKFHEKVSWYGNHENNCYYHQILLIYVWTL